MGDSNALDAQAATLATRELGIELAPEQVTRAVVGAGIHAAARQVLGDPALRARLEAVTAAPGMAALLALLRDSQALHLLVDLGGFELDADAIGGLVDQAALPPLQSASFAALLESVAAAIKAVEDAPEENEGEAGTNSGPLLPEPDLAVVLGEDGLARFFADRSAVLRLPPPAQMLVDVRFLGASRAPVVAESQSELQRISAALFDADRYASAAAMFDRLGEPFIADTARVMGRAASTFHRLLSERQAPDTAQIDAVDALMDGYDRYPIERFAIFGDLRALILSLSANLRLMAAMDGRRPAKVQAQRLAKARQELRRMEAAADQMQAKQAVLLRMLALHGPRLARMQARLEDDTAKREALLRESVAEVNRLTARATLEPEAILRTSQMLTLTLSQAVWKYEEADYPGAIEAVTLAQSLAEAATQVTRNTITPQIEELDKVLLTADPAEAMELRSLRGYMVAGLEHTQSLLDAPQMLEALVQAKRAETEGQYASASGFYEEAGRLERAIGRRLMQLLATVIEAAAQSDALSHRVSANEARAEYFAAMAALNRGDTALIGGQFAEALRHYDDAKAAMLRAAEQWRQAAEDTGAGAAAGDAGMAGRQAAICDLRVRYCDARVELAHAEEQALQGRHQGAAERFVAAQAIFLELNERAVTAQDEARFRSLLRASATYCKGRMLFELALDPSGGTGNPKAAANALEDAARAFEGQGEARWGDYVRALSSEYHLLILRDQAAASPEPFGIALERMAEEAARIFTRLGLPDRAAEVRLLPRAPGHSIVLLSFALPKPGVSLPDPSGMGMASMPLGDRRADDAKRRAAEQKRTEIIGLAAALAGLEKSRNDGDLDAAQYARLLASNTAKLEAARQELRNLETGA
jgi:hypothetical protein